MPLSHAHGYQPIRHNICIPGLEIATDTVTNRTHIFSLVTENSGLVDTLAIRFRFKLKE